MVETKQVPSQGAPLIMKVCVIGTTDRHIEIIRQCADKKIEEDYFQELGFDVSIKLLELEHKLVKLVFLSGIKWYGQDHPEPFFKGAFGCLIFFEYDNRITFDLIEEWYNHITNYVKNPTIYLVGIQGDSPMITQEKAQKLAHQLAIPLFELDDQDFSALERIITELGEKIIITRNHD
jgi:hypothetical protein